MSAVDGDGGQLVAESLRRQRKVLGHPNDDPHRRSRCQAVGRCRRTGDVDRSTRHILIAESDQRGAVGAGEGRGDIRGEDEGARRRSTRRRHAIRGSLDVEDGNQDVDDGDEQQQCQLDELDDRAPVLSTGVFLAGAHGGSSRTA